MGPVVVLDAGCAFPLDADTSTTGAERSMTRSLPEWIGKTDDTPVPLRVKLRVFAKQDNRCAITGWLIRPGDVWECDHVVAIINGGENRERNLRIVLKDKHRKKTDADMKLKSKIASQTAKHLGAKTPSPRSFRSWRRFNGEIVRRDRSDAN
jgi:hypothetical protein